MRLGLFGGTFDPIHLGHLILAEVCREACRLDQVWFVVTASPPHKQGERTSVEHRLEMVRIAIAGHPAFAVSEIEATQPGPHYSYQTLETLRRERPEDELFFLVGADSLAELPGWREPERIVASASVVVMGRPGAKPETSLLQEVLERAPSPGGRPIQHVEAPLIGIASTDLRQRLAQGRSIRYQVPRGVEAYIEAQKLYREPRSR